MNDSPTTDIVEIQSIARQAAQEILMGALGDRPTTDRVLAIASQIVEARFAGQGDFNRSYDLSLRTAEEMGQKAATIANEVKVSLGAIHDLTEKLDRRQTAMEDEQSKMSKDIQLIMLNQAGLHQDIHGNPNEPHSKSLHQMLADMDTKVTTRLDRLEKKTEEHDDYIAKRAKWEEAVVSALKKAWDNRIAKWTILLTIGSYIGIEAFQWDFVQKAILLAEALLK